MNDKLRETFNDVTKTMTPMPPPLKLEIDQKAPTFAVNLSQMLVKESKHRHELKHQTESFQKKELASAIRRSLGW